MTRFAIDAATLVQLVSGEGHVRPRHQAVAPGLIRSQALALLYEAVRAGRMSEERALAHHERMTELKMRLLNDRVSRRTAWRIAREQGWTTTYDAEYLAVAHLQADAFVTVDPGFAAKAQDVVPLAPVTALFEE